MNFELNSSFPKFDKIKLYKKFIDNDVLKSQQLELSQLYLKNKSTFDDAGITSIPNNVTESLNKINKIL